MVDGTFLDEEGEGFVQFPSSRYAGEGSELTEMVIDHFRKLSTEEIS